MRAGGRWTQGALAVLAATCLTAPAQAASGLEPGVHADPGSPAAKEYALPLNQARQTGSERQAGAATGSQASPESTLFGAGIKPPSSPGSPPRAGSRKAPSSSRSGASSSGATGSQAGSGPQAGSGSAPALAEAALRAAREQEQQGGNGSLLALVGGGVAILVLAGFGGTVLRHSRRPSSSA